MADVNPSKLQKYLKGVEYPAHKPGLIDHAKDNGACVGAGYSSPFRYFCDLLGLT